MLSFVGAITLLVICAPSFAVLASVSLDLALQLSAALSINASLSITIPDLIAQIEIAVLLTAGIDVGVTLGLPSFSVALGLDISAQLILVLGLIAALEVALGVGDVALEAMAVAGTGATLGDTVGSAFGTFGEQGITALVLGATTSGPVAAGAVSSVNISGGGMNYETGLCSISFSAAPALGVTAQGSPILNSSGTITGVTLTNPGFGYSVKSPPTVTISDTVNVSHATNASPVVLTIPNTTGVKAVTVAGIVGTTSANGMWCAKIIDGSHIALYQDSALTIPVVGNGAYVSGGTVTGSGSGAAASVVMGGGSQAQLQGFFDGLFFSTEAIVTSIPLLTMCGVMFDLLANLLGNLQLQAKLLASASLNIGVVPPSIAGNIDIVAGIDGIDANLTAALEFFPPIPSVEANISATLSGQAAILLQLVAQIGLLLGFATEEFEVFTYSGPASGLGPALTTALASGWPDSTPASAPTQCVVLAATNPVATAALSAFFPVAA